MGREDGVGRGVAKGHEFDHFGRLRDPQNLPDGVLIEGSDPARTEALGSGGQRQMLHGDGEIDRIPLHSAAHHAVGHQAHAGDDHRGLGDVPLVGTGHG